MQGIDNTPNYLDLFMLGHNRVPNNIDEFDRFVAKEREKQHNAIINSK